MFDYHIALPIIASAILWGSTDALIKYSTPPLVQPVNEENKKRNPFKFAISEFFALLKTPAYLLCLCVNQVGSLLYYYSLSQAPLSLVSPTVNAGKVIANVLTERFFSKERFSAQKCLGLLLILTGIVFQVGS